MESDNVESICTWSKFEVAVFVSRLLGTDMYSKVLKENQVNGKLLLSLKPEGLKKVGISALVHRHAVYGWAQDRIHLHQEQMNMQRRISMESSNKASNMKFRQRIEVLGDQHHSDNNLAIRENEEMCKPVKSFLKENHGSQSRTFSRNLRTIRSWFHQGAGGFSKHELLYGNIKKNLKLKDAIMDIIREGKKDIDPIFIDKKPYHWTDNEIFIKVQQHRNYLKSSKCKNKGDFLEPDDDLNQSTNKTGSNGSGPSDAFSEHAKNTTNKTGSGGSGPGDAFSEHAKNTTQILEGGGISRGVEVEAHSYPFQSNGPCMIVSMFASKVFIPEQVIQYRQEILAARGAVFQFSRVPGFDDQMIGFGCGNLLHRQLGESYERWEIQVTDLCIGNMSTLLLPGTHRAANTISIGERVMLPAVYLSLGEFVPDSIERTQDNRAESPSIPSNEETLQVKLGNFSSELFEKLSFPNCSDFHEDCQSQEHVATSYTKLLVQDGIDFKTLASDNGRGNFKCSSKDQNLADDCYYVDVTFEETNQLQQSEDGGNIFECAKDGGNIFQCVKNQELVCLKNSKDPTNDFQHIENQAIDLNDSPIPKDSKVSRILHAYEGNGDVAESLFHQYKSLAQKDLQNNCIDEGYKDKVIKNYSTPQTTFLCNEEAIGGNVECSTDENKESLTDCNAINENGKRLKKRKFMSMNSMLTPKSSKKATKFKACETTLKKRVLVDVTNRLPQDAMEDSTRHVEGEHIGIIKGGIKRFVKLPSRYRERFSSQQSILHLCPNFIIVNTYCGV